MTKPMTAPDRINLLRPWLNGAYDEHFFWGRDPQSAPFRQDYPAIRRAIAAFVNSFDGSEEAGHVEVINDPAPAGVRPTASEPTDQQLGQLEAWIRIILEQGFGENADALEERKRSLSALGLFVDNANPTWTWSAPSLRFAVRSAGRHRPAKRDHRVVGGATAVRNYKSAGAYVLQVHGPTMELVPFLVAHLLTAPDMVAVKRCERNGCGQFVITATAKRGAPQRFCSTACREWNRELEGQRKKKRRKK